MVQHHMRWEGGGGEDPCWRTKRRALNSQNISVVRRLLGYRHNLTGWLCKQGSVFNARHDSFPEPTAGSNLLPVLSYSTNAVC